MSALAILVLRTGKSLDAVIGGIETQAGHFCQILPVHVDFHRVPIGDVVHLMNVVVRRDQTGHPSGGILLDGFDFEFAIARLRSIV